MLTGVEVEYFHFDRYSESSYRKALRNALKYKPDGLLMAPVAQHVARKTIS